MEDHQRLGHLTIDHSQEEHITVKLTIHRRKLNEVLRDILRNAVTSIFRRSISKPPLPR